MRALFWNHLADRYVETKSEADARIMRDALMLECTGDLEDEKLAAHQFTGEEIDDEAG